ncbi:hypothetical protein [Mycolicibacterium sp. XJ1904]
MTPEHPAYGRLRPVTDTASVLLCDNPGLLTLDGTNTWVLRGPGSDEMVVVEEERLDQVRAALRVLGDDATVRQVVEHVYTDVDEKLWDVAEWSVQAQLDYLRA